MFNVIIAGSRSFNDFNLLVERCDFYLQNKNPNEIVIYNGGARGADKLADTYAKMRGYRIEYFIPDWDTHGKRAGILRNLAMSDNAHALIAFNCGTNGTNHMIAVMRSKGRLVRVVDC